MIMPPKKSEIHVTINNVPRTLMVEQEESLLTALRNASYFSVKFGCDDGTCGVCTVIINGKAVRSCKIKAVDVEGAEIETLEGLSKDGKNHPLQEAFIETGAIQCGYCTPAQILSAKVLLDKNPNPTENEIRKSLNGILCRCTGYVRGIDAVQRASKVLRGEKLKPFTHIEQILPKDMSSVTLPEAFYRRDGSRNPLPPLVFTPSEMKKTNVVGKSEIKVDAQKLAQGRPVFTDDIHMEGMLYGALLTSPHAHANIKNINASQARQLPGVHAVLTFKDIPRVQKALDLIEVEYEVLPVVVDPEKAMQKNAPIIHDEPDTKDIYDAQHNIVHHIEAEVGNVEKAFAEADHVFDVF